MCYEFPAFHTHKQDVYFLFDLGRYTYYLGMYFNRFKFHPLRVAVLTTIYGFGFYKWWMYISSQVPGLSIKLLSSVFFFWSKFLELVVIRNLISYDCLCLLSLLEFFLNIVCYCYFKVFFCLNVIFISLFVVPCVFTF